MIEFAFNQHIYDQDGPDWWRDRRRVERAIERLIGLLDELDEATGTVDDEPSLSLWDWAPDPAPVDLEMDTADDEPSLGSADKAEDQTGWAEHDDVNGWAVDAEVDAGDEPEPDADQEPPFSVPDGPWAPGLSALGC
jgi:hypothetical protein